MGDLILTEDEELAALYWAMHRIPTPEHVEKARQGQQDLWQRIKSEPFRPLTRDERRLDAHYRKIRDGHVAAVVVAYRNR